MTVIEHREAAPEEVNVGVLTISDSRSAAMEEGRDEDESGKIIQRRLEEEGYTSERFILPDEDEEIEEQLEDFISNSEYDAIISTGGTGITSRDRTVEVARRFFDKKLPGFGESLRRIGYEKVGVAGIITRATAGIADQKPIFCLPGAPNAVKVGMKLILPDLAHLVKHARE